MTNEDKKLGTLIKGAFVIGTLAVAVEGTNLEAGADIASRVRQAMNPDAITQIDERQDLLTVSDEVYHSIMESMRSSISDMPLEHQQIVHSGVVRAKSLIDNDIKQGRISKEEEIAGAMLLHVEDALVAYQPDLTEMRNYMGIGDSEYYQEEPGYKEQHVTHHQQVISYVDPKLQSTHIYTPPYQPTPAPRRNPNYHYNCNYYGNYPRYRTVPRNHPVRRHSGYRHPGQKQFPRMPVIIFRKDGKSLTIGPDRIEYRRLRHPRLNQRPGRPHIRNRERIVIRVR